MPAVCYSGVSAGRCYVFESYAAFLCWQSHLNGSPLDFQLLAHATRGEAEARLRCLPGCGAASRAQFVGELKLTRSPSQLPLAVGSAREEAEGAGGGARKTSLTPLQRARAEAPPGGFYLPSYTSTIFVASEGDEARGAAAESRREAGRGVDSAALAFVEGEAGEEEGERPEGAGEGESRGMGAARAAGRSIRSTTPTPARREAQLELNVSVLPSAWPRFDFSVNAMGTGEALAAVRGISVRPCWREVGSGPGVSTRPRHAAAILTALDTDVGQRAGVLRLPTMDLYQTLRSHVPKWKKNGWKLSRGNKPVPHAEMLAELDAVVAHRMLEIAPPTTLRIA